MDKKAIDGLRNTLIQYNLEAVDLRGVFSQVYNKAPSFHFKCFFLYFRLSVSAVVMSYLQNPQPMAASW